MELDENEILDKMHFIEEIDTGIARNSDTVGWLMIPNSDVNNAVLQRRDPNRTHFENNSYYLDIDEDKNRSVFSCYWVDPDSVMGSRERLSKNTIIYGHSDLKDNPDGRRFSQLFKYTDLEFLKKNPYIYYSTIGEDMIWEVFAVFYTHIDFNYIQANPTKEQFDYIVSEAKARSEYIIDMPVKDGDNILTLSTCSAYYNTSNPDDYRLVIMARLLPADQDTLSRTDVAVNPAPKKS